MRFADIVGTDGPDRIVGTGAAEVICGLDGDDVIEGGGGADVIYGGPGADHLSYTAGPGDDRIGTDLVFQLWGGPGEDVLQGIRTPDGDIYPDLLIGGDGNDVLIGPLVGPGVMAEGGKGNDAMIGTPFTTTGSNHMNGGDGQDVAVTLNLSTGVIRPDRIDLDGKPEIKLGSTCTVAVPLDPEPGRRSQGRVSCGIPWPRELSGLEDVVSISTSVDQKGKVSFDASMYEGLASLSVSSWRNTVEAQASFPPEPAGVPRHSGRWLSAGTRRVSSICCWCWGR